MKKKLLLALAAVVIAVQLLVPGVAIIQKYTVLRTGVECKFKVYPVDPYDAFRGRYVSFSVMTGNLGIGESRIGEYGLIEVGEDGFATISEVTKEKPQSGIYIKSDSDDWFDIPLDRYYMDEELAPRAEELTRFDSKKEAYVIVRIKDGKCVVSGMYIDGVPIEDVIKNEMT